MTDLEQLLTERLAARADAVPVGPAPVADLVRAAAVRRRRPYVVLAAAAAVAVVVGGLVVGLSGPGPESGPAPTPPVPSVSDPTPDPLSASRVGGRLSVEVPRSWTRSATGCGGVAGDVVIAATGFVHCPVRWAPGVEAIRFDVARPDSRAAESITVDGESVLRTPVRCDRALGFRRCSAVLWDPVQDLGLRVLSATSPDTVEEILRTAAIDDALVSVPGPFGFSGVAYTWGHFRLAAEGRGLRVRMPADSEDRVWEIGRTTVSPAPGTAVPPGTVVRVRPSR